MAKPKRELLPKVFVVIHASHSNPDECTHHAWAVFTTREAAERYAGSDTFGDLQIDEVELHG